MTGEQEDSGRCYFCRGSLRKGKATVPFVLDDSVIVVKKVPAEICNQCNEPIMSGEVVDKVNSLLELFEPFRAEVLVVSYNEDLPDRSEAAPNVIGIEPR